MYMKNSEDANFNVVEVNQLMSLTHVSLKFKNATDDILKVYLANKLSKEK